jgi:membrane carboxypeptidase/penicillin-binding protein PbpC
MNWHRSPLIAALAFLIVYGGLLAIAWFRRRRIQPKAFPTIKGTLIRIHRDLFAIERKLIWNEGAPVLTIFEKIVLVLEDKRFLRHNGFDLIAGTRELLKTLMLRKHGGASTIDMQFVRTATGFKAKTFSRKIYEITLSVIIQFRYSKLTILRSYLNCAFFGSGLHGAEHASLKAFGRPVFQLSRNEAAQLASMLVYPRPLRAEKKWRMKIERRAAYGLRRMARLEESFKKIPTRE